jgi:DNA-binding transcriptional ArsR family regulator
VDNSLDRAADLLRALGHPVRVRVIEILAEQETCFCNMQAMLSLEQSSLSQHLQVLRRMGLVASRKADSQTIYRLTNPHLPAVLLAARKATASSELLAAPTEA